MSKRKYTAAELVGLLRCKYSGNAYSVLEQVADGTGAGCTSWIDAAIFSLWPSNGIWRAACEVKVSRSDFLGELSSPTKNEWARTHFDFFWYVVAPGVAKDDEIPTGCGLMVVRGNGLGVVKHAPRRENVITDEHVIASFARSLDKERERFFKHGLREAIESDHNYQRAKAWQEGAERFIRSCGEHCFPKDADDVYKKLTECNRDKSPAAAEADHVLRVLESLNDDVVNFLLRLAPMAESLLNARDEAGEFLVKRWGGRDERAVESLRKLAKRGAKGYSDRHTRDESRTKLAVREILAGMKAEAAP